MFGLMLENKYKFLIILVGVLFLFFLSACANISLPVDFDVDDVDDSVDDVDDSVDDVDVDKDLGGGSIIPIDDVDDVDDPVIENVRVVGISASDYEVSGSMINSPNNLLDGNLISRWSALGEGQWAQFNLSSNINLSWIRIAAHLGDKRIAYFSIHTSLDGVSFQKVFDGSTSSLTTDFENYSLSPSSAQFVRLVGHGSNMSGPDGWNSYTQVDIQGLLVDVDLSVVHNPVEPRESVEIVDPIESAPDDKSVEFGRSTFPQGHDPKGKNIVFSLNFNHRPLGKYATRAEFRSDWRSSWGDRGHEFEIVRDPVDNSNKVGLLTFPFYDSSDFKWGCWTHPDCGDSQLRRIYFDEKPDFGNAFMLNGVGPGSGGGQWFVDLEGNYEEAYFSYRIKFSPDFDAVGGGKMPGGFYPLPRICSSCENTDCRNADGSRCAKSDQPCDGVADYFAMRHMFHKDRIRYYLYFADKKNLCGDSKSLSNSDVLFDGNWHTVTAYLKLNTPDVSNGVVRTWIDGVETTSWTGLLFRTKDNRLTIDSFAISTFYGGGGTTRCQKTSSWIHQCNIGYIESWIQPTYNICAVDPTDPCSDVLRYSDGEPYYRYAPRKTEFMYIDEILVYVP
jgi:hypothetical protein